MDATADLSGNAPTFAIRLIHGGDIQTRHLRLLRGSGTAKLVFVYTVDTGDNERAGLSALSNNLSSDGQIVSSASGVPAVRDHDGVALQQGHKVNGALTEGDARLSALSLSGITFDQAFEPSRNEYTASTTAARTTLAYTELTNRAIVISRYISPSDAAIDDLGHQVDLEEGDTVISVWVNAPLCGSEDVCRAHRIYTITVTRAAARSDLPPPRNLRAVEEKGAVKLNWDAPDDDTVTGYRIERRPAGGAHRDSHTLVEDTGSSETGYVDQSAEKGVEYEYRVSARNEGGAGEASGWVSTAPDEEPVASEDVAVWSAIMTVEWVYQGYGYYSTDTKQAGSLSPASFEVDGMTYTVQMVETQGWWTYIGVDRELPFDFVLELDGARFASDDASFASYSYGNIYRWEGTGLSLSDGDTVEVRLLGAVEDEAAVNSAATGAPIVSGTAQVGETLTADTSGISDEDGLENAAFTYQWLADNAAIAGATGSTHTLSDADEGKAIQVRVSFTDDAGNDETLTSAATDAVAAAPTPNSPATGEPAIAGTAQVGERLTADISGISDTDGLTSVSYSYQWLADNAAIAGATGSTYTLADGAEGKAITVQVSFTDDAGNPESLTSAATDAVAAATQPNNPATGAPTIRGTAQVGETLTADTSGIADEDGLDDASFTYQWLADGIEISAATGSTYTLADGDKGKTIAVEVSFADDAGNPETLTSAATDTVAAAPTPNNPATGAPTIGGTAQVSETLTVDTSGIADADGISNATFSYQWQAAAADISGATDSTYTLVAADEGKTVKVQLTFTDDAGNEESLTSAATVAVAPAPAPNSPATGEPTISGTAQVGETLMADSSGIADEDGLENVTFSYQWLADNRDIPGATESAYTLSEADEGKTVTVRVSFTDDGGNDETLSSAATEAVAGNEEPVAGEDVAVWSAIMTVEWVYQGYGYYSTDAKKAGSLSPASFEVDGTTYTVKMVETQGWMYIGVDRELPFDFVLELDGARFASDDASFASYSYGNIYRWEGTGLSLSDGESVEVRLLGAFEDETAVNSAATGAPVISGTVQVGETLTADTSGISDEDGLENVTYAYQWLADDTAIQGATNPTYILAEADEGKTVKVRVSFTDDAGNEETLTSAATDAVSAPPTPNNPATGVPTISGTAQVGETLTAGTSGIADDDGLDNVSYSYQWLADDAETAGATGSTYTLVDADAGKSISVRVSFSDDAGNEETLTSGATDAVAAPEPPAEPTGLSATATHDQVALTWDAPNDDSITGYVILRRNRDTDAEGEFTELVPDTGSAATSYTDESVAAETPYTYRIKAINEHGVSERSRWLHIDTPAVPVPAEPTGLSATATHDQVELTWDAPGDDSITGYVILRRNRDTDAEGEFTELVSDTGSADTTYTDDTVSSETPYTYRIKAINEHGVSERSRWFHIDTTAAPVPEG